jgi:hypothetical protein
MARPALAVCLTGPALFVLWLGSEPEWYPYAWICLGLAVELLTGLHGWVLAHWVVPGSWLVGWGKNVELGRELELYSRQGLGLLVEIMALGALALAVLAGPAQVLEEKGWPATGTTTGTGEMA